MPASLRKSQAACEAWPAPPPEPTKNSRPPRARVAASVSTTASMSASGTRRRISIESSRNCRENPVTELAP